jgi:hypothetical protein
MPLPTGGNLGRRSEKSRADFERWRVHWVRKILKREVVKDLFRAVIQSVHLLSL